MKRRTHNVFSFAVALWLSAYLRTSDSLIYSVALSLFFSIALNWLIDSVAGHKGMRRTPYTHSPIGVFVFSLLLVVSVATISYIFGVLVSISMLLELLFFAYMIGVSHLFLDMLTADGIYILWPFTSNRLSLLKARYDNKPLNNFIQLVSLVAIALRILKLIGYSVL